MIFNSEQYSQVTFNFMGHTYRQIELAEAFERVCSKTDWNAPINAVVLTDDVPVTCAAIEFFTATHAKVRNLNFSNSAEITSIGYRMGPAGDH